MEYNKSLYDSLKKLMDKHNELTKSLEEMTSGDFAKVRSINQQLKQTTKVANVYDKYLKLINGALEAEQILHNEKDQSLLELAQMELDEAKSQIPGLEEEMKKLLLPVDPNNDKNVIIEIRPAAGGDEASIFVGDIFEMYKRYIDTKGWKTQIIDIVQGSFGFDFIAFSVSGDDVYSMLKFESGVHRVQRVPATEAKGRVHTSTITVSVMPELEDLDIQIKESDLRIDKYRASGAGGQHINKTESAIRITHIPTGVVASCQEGKSQHSNRDTAMKMLRAKIWEAAEEARAKEQGAIRKGQVGSGERSEKIRTYNYPQNRVTDHRVGLTLNRLEHIMLGDMQEIIDSLIAAEQASLMEEFTI